MNIDELQKQLVQRKQVQLDDRPAAPHEFEPGHVEVPPAPQQAEHWEPEQKASFSLNISKQFYWIAGGIFVAAVLAVAGWLVWQWKFAFDTDKVALDIFGQERIVSGEQINYIVRYKNNTNAVLKNPVLTFIFSGQSVSDDEGAVKIGDLPAIKKNIGDIQPGESGQAEFRARVLGDKDSQQKFSAKLEYRPSTVNSEFANEAEFSSVIISVPLVLNFDLPAKIVSGQTLNFALKYLNTSDAVFSDSRIKVDFPEGFSLESSLPSPVSNNTWAIPEIGSREEGRIMIKGSISGKEGDSKIFKAQIGLDGEKGFTPYAQGISSPAISVSPLWVEQSLIGNDDARIDPNTALNFRLKYRNTTDSSIGPVVITVKIDSRVVDLSSVSASKGFFSSSDQTITWNQSSAPELESLAAHSEGELNFEMKVKDKLPVASFADKNFTVVTRAKIDSPNTPQSLLGTQLAGTNDFTVKINSRLVCQMKGYYFDRTISNSGPLPPKVGQKTTYTIYWQILNVSNELKDVKVEAFLPSYVQWTNAVYPGGQDVTYNASTGKIVWNVGKLDPAAGILTPVKQLVFQVAFTPSVSQLGSDPILIKDVTATGADVFTGASLTASDQGLQTDLPDDPGVGYDKGKVSN